ncbi:MAG TPA: hypothetical protein VHO06_26620 [Polyangia bacterium]|nr:hypothetical protein [Polyangia bacterium]
MHPSRDRLLTVLDQHGDATLGELAGVLGWSAARTGMSLLRARKASLVCRSSHLYRLSDRGRARLDWWRRGSGR